MIKSSNPGEELDASWRCWEGLALHCAHPSPVKFSYELMAAAQAIWGFKVQMT